MMNTEVFNVLDATEEQIILIERCAEYVAKIKKIPYINAKTIICDTIVKNMSEQEYSSLISLIKRPDKEKKRLFEENVMNVISDLRLHPKIDFFAAEKIYNDWKIEFKI